MLLQPKVCAIELVLHNVKFNAGLSIQILTWGGSVPPHRGGTSGGGQGPDGGGLARDSRHFLQTLKMRQFISKSVYKLHNKD